MDSPALCQTSICLFGGPVHCGRRSIMLSMKPTLSWNCSLHKLRFFKHVSLCLPMIFMCKFWICEQEIDMNNRFSQDLLAKSCQLYCAFPPWPSSTRRLGLEHCVSCWCNLFAFQGLQKRYSTKWCTNCLPTLLVSISNKVGRPFFLLEILAKYSCQNSENVKI